MSNLTNLTLDTRELDRIVAGNRAKIIQVVKKFAFRVERGAKMRAPVMTGALRASIHTKITGGEGTDPQGVTELNPKAIETPLPDVESESTYAIVGPTVSYAAAVEFGSSKRAAKPYLTPAIEQEREAWEDGSYWKDIVE